MNFDPPDYLFDPPEDPIPPCPHCGLDPACDCDPDACQTCGRLPGECGCDDEPRDDYEGDLYLEPFEIDGEDEPIPEDE